jgi:hypothetical protein
MPVTRLEVRSRGPYESGAEFGEARAYERIDGVLHFAADPQSPANAAIVDLARAERDAGGRVRFLADFCLLQPVEPERANRRLLFDVVNRGRKTVIGGFNRSSRELEPSERIDPGDGWLMRNGWTVAFCGWQWDVVRGGPLMGLEAPQALEGGRPIAGKVLVTFQTAQRMADHLLADRVHQPYPAAHPDDAEATLSVRDWPDGPATEIPRERWRFARAEGGRPVADPTRVWLDGGFEPGRIYEAVYRTSICPVVGTGLLAVRDCVSFLRFASAAERNPSAGRIEYAYASGASQSGRFLRTFLYHGLNLDEQGRQVFDGLLPHIAGARRGQFNHRYAQPSMQYGHGFGHLPPFSWNDQTDPLTGATDGLLRRQRALGGVPRIVEMNSSAEYWRGDASLLHTDMAGTRDVEPPEEVRLYHVAGSQHVVGAPPLTNVSAIDGSRGAHAFNVVDYSPLRRATLVNLDRWVSARVEPPPSRFPRLADGTAARAGEVVAAVGAFPGATQPAADRLRTIRRVDLGPLAVEGVGSFPAKTGEPYVTYVAAVDADGNERGGVHPPDVEVPVATYTGWNPRHADSGGGGQIMDMLGSTLPFVATASQRRQAGDPRPSIAERYRDREEYEARVRAVAQQLAAERYILPEDVDLAVRLAVRRYDAFAAVPAAAGGEG